MLMLITTIVSDVIALWITPCGKTSGKVDVFYRTVKLFVFN